jgi:hypothetical protein
MTYGINCNIQNVLCAQELPRCKVDLDIHSLSEDRLANLLNNVYINF